MILRLNNCQYHEEDVHVTVRHITIDLLLWTGTLTDVYSLECNKGHSLLAHSEARKV